MIKNGYRTVTHSSNRWALQFPPSSGFPCYTFPKSYRFQVNISLKAIKLNIRLIINSQLTTIFDARVRISVNVTVL